MSDSTVDPTLDRLLRHMAWANATLIGWLGGLSDEALAATAPQNEWSAGRILDHLVNAAGGYATRLDGDRRTIRLSGSRYHRCSRFSRRFRTRIDQGSLTPWWLRSMTNRLIG